MAAFKRKTELFVGIFKDNTSAEMNGYLIDGLNYDFNITRSTDFYKDTATFTIYNPSQTTIDEVMTRGTSVVFKAGYEGVAVGVIFVGQIGVAYPEESENGEIKLILICNSQRGAQYPLSRTMFMASFRRGQSYYDVLKSIADFVGVPVSGAEKLKKYYLDSALVLNGDVRSEIETFVSRKLRRIGGKIIITNNELIYLDYSNTVHYDTVYLTYDSGLISVTPRRDETYQSSEDAFMENTEFYLGFKDKIPKEQMLQKIAEAKAPQKNIIDFACIINPAIQLLGGIFIDARKNSNDKISTVGLFYVQNLVYQGNNYGGEFVINGIAEETRENKKDVLNA